MKNLFLTALFLLLAINVSAQKGACGSEVSWTLSDGTLTISGTGAMNDVSSADQFSYYVYRNNINHVVIKSGVTSVGSNAFYHYDKLQTVTFEEGLEVIGGSAFNGCSGIEQITLPEGIKKIGGSAFSGTGIASITIPESLESISTAAFDRCDLLTTVNWNAIRCKVGGYSPFGDGKMFYGPGTVTEVNFGFNVEEIPGGLFECCTVLETVNTSGSISIVGEDAFRGTAWLNNQPDGIIYVDKALYKYQGTMTEPTSIVVKEGTESITNNAFRRCSYLTDITIPSTLKTMGDYVFDQCPALSHLTWNAIQCTDFEYAPFGDTGLYEVTLGSQVTNIPNKMFYQCQMLESIEMSPNIVTIGVDAFGGCTSLKHVDLPSTLQSIGASAFSGCTKLDHVIIPEGLKTLAYSSFSGVKNVTYNAIHCEVETVMKMPVFDSSLETFVIGDKVEYIPEYICYGGPEISNLVIPNSVEEIGVGAFGGCKINSLTIGENVKKIHSTFGSGVKELTWNAIDVEGSNHISSTDIERLTIGDKVKLIPDDLCNGCTQLASFVIPESVETIGRAFNNCSSLTEVIIPNSVKNMSGFNSCDNLQSVEIGENVTTMNGLANCNNLSTVVWNAIHCDEAQLPSGVTDVKIGDKVELIPAKFCRDCANLTSISLPASVTEIGENAFSGCLSMTNVNIPSSLKTISQRAFFNSGLVKLFIPASVTSIEDNAFSYNSQLEEVIVASDMVIPVRSPFQYCDNLMSIYVADVAAFNSDSFWSSYSQYIKPMLEFAENEFVYSGLALQMPQTTNCLPNHEVQIEPAEMATDAGTYSKQFLANYTGEHNFSVHIPYNYTIKKAQLVLTPTTTEKVYGEEEPIIEYSTLGLVGEETLEDATEELPELTANTDAASYVSEYPITFAKTPVSKNYEISVIPANLVVRPKQLHVTVKDVVRRYSENNPEFTIVYEGFVNNDDESDLSALPIAWCEADEFSPIGEYPIHITEGSALNYTIVCADGTLTIEKGVQTIVWDQTPQTLYVGDKMTLNASSSSSLPMTFESDNTEVCTIELVNDEYVLVCHTAGVAHISAIQSGDQNWNAAEPIVKEFVVNLSTGVSYNSAEGITIGTDNSCIRVNGAANGIPVSVYSLNGTMLHHSISNGNELVFNVERGSVYVIRIGNMSFKVATR